MERVELLDHLARHVLETQHPHPLRVGIDGVDCSGKTHFADELGRAIGRLGRPVLRASTDGFHNPRAVRYRKGPDSPEGYYYDSFNYALMRRMLLDPLGPGGDRHCRLAAFDVRVDSPVQVAEILAAPDAALLFDGIFLARPELEGCFDLRIFLVVSFDTVLERASQRDLNLFQNVEAVRSQYRQRYIPGQQLYFAACRPQETADIVIDHNDFLNPLILQSN
jgi:uridine kinase